MTANNPTSGWRPGQSGNPRGRPVGSGEVAKLRAAITEHLPEIIDALMERAVNGDIGAARLLLERGIAPLKAVEPSQPVRLPDGDLSAQGRAVIDSVASGDLSVGQGASLLSAISALARVVEVDELTRRIEALESRHVNP